MSGLSEREIQDFAVTIAALLAGRCDGAQAVATTAAQVEAIVARHVEAALTEAAEQRSRVEALVDEWEADRGILSPDSRYTRDVMVRELRDVLADPAP